LIRLARSWPSLSSGLISLQFRKFRNSIEIEALRIPIPLSDDKSIFGQAASDSLQVKRLIQRAKETAGKSIQAVTVLASGQIQCSMANVTVNHRTKGGQQDETNEQQHRPYRRQKETQRHQRQRSDELDASKQPMGANPNLGRLERPRSADADKTVGPELWQIISHHRKQNQHRESAQPEHVQFPTQRRGINQQRHRDHETADGQAKNFKDIPQASQCFRAVAFQTRIELVDETEQQYQPDIRERYEK